jgi:peptidoglycan/LPS O-acetylase OafA/YrhL
VKSAVIAFESSSSVPHRPASSVSTPPAQRLPAFDYLRVFVIFLVVLHHAVFAYCTDGHPASGGGYTNGSAPVVDGAEWSGFNALVRWNDSFFMPLMFLLAGLFVRPSLERKGLARYLADRALRLGVPLLVGIVTVVPLSYYAAYLQGGGAPGFAAFWTKMVTTGPWPSGPLWFVGALLVLDLASVLLLSRARVQQITAALDRLPPTRWFLPFVALAALAYLPLQAALGSSLWLTAGPFGIQASRIGLYALFFVAGVVVGADRLTAGFTRQWLRWPLLAVLATVLLFSGSLPEWADGFVMVLFATAMAAGLLAVAVHLGRRRSPVGDNLGANAYGIYLMHWPIVLWLQFALLRVRLGAIEKGLLVLTSGFALSWLAAGLMRRLPKVARIV